VAADETDDGENSAFTTLLPAKASRQRKKPAYMTVTRDPAPSSTGPLWCGVDGITDGGGGDDTWEGVCYSLFFKINILGEARELAGD
jgi:hypothetical protein